MYTLYEQCTKEDFIATSSLFISPSCGVDLHERHQLVKPRLEWGGRGIVLSDTIKKYDKKIAI